ncbi:MAG: hypothetical protein K0S47_1586 [Herbinix sp.]|jgi:membrane protease YdiL (CAAX protease family)|nr:hypothetical protein [Herbinix sp.]
MKKFLSIIVAVLPALAAFGIQVLGAILFLIFYGIIYFLTTGISAINSGDGDVASSLEDFVNNVLLSTEVNYLGSALSIVLCGVVFYFWYRGITRNEAKVKLRSICTGKNIGLLVLLGLGSQFLISGLLSMILPFMEDLLTDYAETMELLQSGNTIVVVLLTVLIAPICEELIFRGVILHNLNRQLPFLAANLIQAALFGIYHMNIVQGVYAFLLGYVLGYVFYKFRTIVAPIALHMIVNSSAFLIELFPSYYFVFILFLVIGAIAMFVAIFFIQKTEAPIMVMKTKISSYGDFDDN